MNTEQLPAPPQRSPDGRWWWDGWQWVPVPIRRQLNSRLALVGAITGGVLVIGLIGAAVGGHQLALGRCEAVPAGTVAVIEQGSDLEGFSLSHARAVRSRDFKKVWFVSALVDVPGYPTSTGTWATNDLGIGDGPGLMMAVDLSARTSTRWGTPRDMTMNDEGAQLSRECVAER